MLDGVAYFAMGVIFEHKMFMKLTAGVNFINLYVSSSPKLRKNYPEDLSLESFSG
jgi:hypothetical protein